MEPPRESFAVGIVDVEYDADHFSSCKQGIPDPKNHVVGRIFYPAASVQAGSGVTYLPHPYYAYGLARFLTAFAGTNWWSPILKAIVAFLLCCVGSFMRMPTARAAPVATTVELPVVLFSHGVGGTRFIYTYFARQLSSLGFLVFVLEHADGLGGGTRLAGNRGWVFFLRWGDQPYLESRVRHRVEEVKTAMRVLEGINAVGSRVPGLSVQFPSRSGADADALDAMCGRLQLQSTVLAGHSYGGATVAEVASQQPGAACSVLFDPWYVSIPEASHARSKWQHTCPTLVLGSHFFNHPQKKCGTKICEGSSTGLQEQVLKAAAGSSHGTEAMLLVPNGSQHSLVDDLGVFLFDRYRWFFRLLGRKCAHRHPGSDMADRCIASMLLFIVRHVRLPEDQKQRICGKLSTCLQEGNSAALQMQLSEVLVADALRQHCTLFKAQSAAGVHGSGLYRSQCFRGRKDGGVDVMVDA